jgi:hypothetical protein
MALSCAMTERKKTGKVCNFEAFEKMKARKQKRPPPEQGPFIFKTVLLTPVSAPGFLSVPTVLQA